MTTVIELVEDKRVGGGGKVGDGVKLHQHYACIKQEQRTILQLSLTGIVNILVTIICVELAEARMFK